MLRTQGASAMRVLNVSFAVTTAMALAGCGPDTTDYGTSAQSSNVGQSDAEMEFCVDVEWAGQEYAEPGIFLVPVRVNGDLLKMQVDTGADYGGLYGAVADWPDIAFSESESGPSNVDIKSITIAGRPLNPDNMLHYDSNNRGEVSGTIGYDNLRGRIWLIDPNADRFCNLEPDHSLMRTAQFVDTPIRYNKQYLPLEFNGEAIEGVFFDTGSVFSVLLPDLWHLTTDPNTASVDVEVPAWGEMITLNGQGARPGWTMGGQTVPLEIIFREDNPDILRDDRLDVPMKGLFGMSAFPSKAVVLDLRDGKERFGLVPFLPQEPDADSP